MVLEYSVNDSIIHVRAHRESKALREQRGVLLSYPGGQTLLRKERLDDVENWLKVEAGGLELLA